MGFLDAVSKKAKEAADGAKKVAGQAMDNAAKAAKDLSEKASVGGSNILDKVSDRFASVRETVGTSAKELSAWAESMPDTLKKMADDFDADAMWNKLSKTAAKAGQELIVMVLTIYYALEAKITSKQNDDENEKSE